MTFTDAQQSTIARLAHSAEEGSGSGHTVYAADAKSRRYVVGGYRPSLMFPIGTARPVIRAAIRRLMHDAAQAETLGYWEDRGTVYVDLGNTFNSLHMALHVAARRCELAIYDTQTGECIPVQEFECGVCHARALTADAVSHDDFCPGAVFAHHVAEVAA